MFIANYPEDSTLRRHCDSAAAFRSQAFLALPPTDSMLRRHFEQRLRAAAEPSMPPKAAPNQPATPSSPASRSAPPDIDNGGGILGWLKRLFG